MSLQALAASLRRSIAPLRSRAATLLNRRTGAGSPFSFSASKATAESTGFTRRWFRSSAAAAADRTKGKFVLQDTKGKTLEFEGYSFGAEAPRVGEAVFNTGMVGYPEALTDPSYRGEILVLTYPLIGNYGVPPRTRDELGLFKFFESDRIHVEGLIVSNYSEQYSHWNAFRSLSDWLKAEGIPALYGVDTRAVTKFLREGTAFSKIVFPGKDIPISNPYERNLVAEVSTKEPKVYGNGGIRIVAYDCGMKYNIIRNLVARGTTVKVVPWDHDISREDYDGLFISNGPGDPEKADVTVQQIRKAMEKGKPIFGICMGNQLLAIAAGAKTYKLNYGNRGQNQPALNLLENQAYITSQNHGFAVDTKTLPANWRPFFVNINDGSNEGIICNDKPFFSVQFHPEARVGPYDTQFLFDRFINLVREKKTLADKFTPKRLNKTVKKVLILGSGGLQIGQAGEFDYSGSQAVKAMKEEGIHTVLINPNIATVQTAKGLADRVYFMPLNPTFVEGVIEKEKPDGLLLAFGGQTALNCGVALYEKGVLKKHSLRVLGTPVESIMATEDRELFAKALGEINVPIAPSIPVNTVEDALAAAEKIGYPVIIRAAYALGGLGSGFANKREELEELAAKALGSSPQILVEKSVKGWKEVEYEVVRDIKNNCITVCNMENFDPMGIHTGESIVVAPSQTLTNEEYHKLRSTAIKTVQHLGIVGECNIQYALDPKSEDFVVIEINARLSRSSALASKATGYPLAFVAAKLGLGFELHEVKNSITKETSAMFEPSLDYCVVKMPRWDLTKFTRVSKKIGSQMKSVGEVMSIGRNFEEALQKAIRMNNSSGNEGFEAKKWATASDEEILQELVQPTDQRIFALHAALSRGIDVEKLHELTKIDQWFLHKLKNIHSLEGVLRSHTLDTLTKEVLHEAKRKGFSDRQIAKCIGSSELDVRKRRKSLGVLPVVKQIDTLAAEFPAKTNYLFMTYDATVNDLPHDKGGVVILGSGVYRIGSSVEFDCCGVSAARSFRKKGKKTIIINYNPETVSTDYDESYKLYFEELTFERVMDIIDRESPEGVVVSVGGQEPQNLALKLHQQGVPIFGTSAVSIDMAEDRNKFGKLLDELGVDQPAWSELRSYDEAVGFCRRVGFPVLVRPSYVLSGAAMNVVYDESQLKHYLEAATEVSKEHPVVISQFIQGAREVEIDAVAQDGVLINWAVSEHVEDAGVHSGDATLVLPPHSISKDVQARIVEIATKIAKALKIQGPFNTQFLVKGNAIKVIETNLRASRSLPFVSKVLNIDFIETATRVWMGERLKPDPRCEQPLKHWGVKAPQFSFQRLVDSDPVLGVEMKSTGEVATFGDDFHEAFLKSLVAANFKLPKRNSNMLLVGSIPQEFVPSIVDLRKQGFRLYATPDTAEQLARDHNIDTTVLLYERKEGTENAPTWLRQQKISLVFNFPHVGESELVYQVRRRAVDFTVPVVTNLQIATTLVAALGKVKQFNYKAWDEYCPGASNWIVNI